MIRNKQPFEDEHSNVNNSHTIKRSVGVSMSITAPSRYPHGAWCFPVFINALATHKHFQTPQADSPAVTTQEAKSTSENSYPPKKRDRACIWLPYAGGWIALHC